MTAALLSTTSAALVAAAVAWLVGSRVVARLVFAAAAMALLAASGLLALAGAHPHGRAAYVAELLVAGGLAVVGGGPLTTAVLHLVDRGKARVHSLQQAGEVLRGGALIGALERGAIFGSLVAGWPEGIAVVLAVKGLARYPELRGPDQPDAAVSSHAVAERFIIGTFVSVLWAVTCGGLLPS